MATLTDLTCLENLRLDNDNRNEVLSMPYTRIDPTLFRNATKLQKISAERMSPDIVALIDLVRANASSDSVLTGIAAPHYLDTVFDPEEGPELQQIAVTRGGPMYSIPLEKTGFHWKRVSYGQKLESGIAISTAAELIGNFVVHCTRLEELYVPIPQNYWDEFQNSILPRLSQLRVLIVTRGGIADLSGPSQPYHWPHLSKTKREEWSNMNEAIVAEQEGQRRAHSISIFKQNREKAAREHSGVNLIYFGMGRHVYTCLMLPRASKGGLTFKTGEDVWHVIKLSRMESSRFDVIVEMDEERD